MALSSARQNISGRRGMMNSGTGRGTPKTNFLPGRRRVGRTEDRWRPLRRTTSKRRLGRRSVRRQNSRFEAVDRNNILARPNL